MVCVLTKLAYSEGGFTAVHLTRSGQLASTDAEARQLHAQLLQSHELAELLAQQLAGERAAARNQFEEFQQQLSKEQAQLQAQTSAYAALQAECDSLRASLAEEKKAHAVERQARAGLDAQVANLASELQTCCAELKTAEQRLARAANDKTLQDEQLLQEVQRRRTADVVLIQDLQQGVQRLKERLEQERRDAEKEQQLLRTRLEREQELREGLERQCAENRKQLQDDHQSHIAALAQLSRQLSDRMLELQQTNETARRLHEQLAATEKRYKDKALELQQASDTISQLEEQLVAAEKRAAARDTRITELESTLERNSKKLCQQANSRDAAVAGLQEQLEQRQRKLEQKEAEIREAQESYSRQLGQLEKRLAQSEAAAREQETRLQQQLDRARRQTADTEAQLQARLVELQGLLASRDEQIKQLTEGHAAEGTQREKRLRKLQADHEAEVRSAAAAVDALVDNLLRNTSDLAGGALGQIGEDDDGDEDRGPAADLILGMSQPHLSQGHGGHPVAQQPGVPAGTTAQQTAAAAATFAAGTRDQGAAGHTGSPAKKTEACKRAPEGGAREGDEQPAGRGRGRKAAKLAKDDRWVEAIKDLGQSNPAAANSMDSRDAPSQAAPDDGPSTRAGSRRRAAQAGQARAKAMAAALADDLEAETETATLGAMGPEAGAARGRRAAQRAATQEAALAAEPQKAIAPPEAAPAGSKRGRAAGSRGKGGKQAKGSQPQETEEMQSESAIAAEPQAPIRRDAEQKPPAAASHEDASLMPPPARPATRRRGAAAAVVTKPAELAEVIPATQDVDLAASQQPTQQQHVSQPPTQPQPPPPPAQPLAAPAGRPQQQAVGAAGGVAGSLPSFSQQGMPTASQTSLFGTFKDFGISLGKNPLATVNPKVMEASKGRMRIVPFTSVHNWKIVTPSVFKKPEGAQAAAGPANVLPQLTHGNLAVPGPSVGSQPGEAMPPDVLLRTLKQQPANKGGKKGS
ncbi:hypothetical protein VOLCADRAFT_96367 [Volvox carteri f. nagariensis]|uniref:Uncharacterized protein n=1 Tax=Volvox carteri f. nagariensis TaxID=3068 RepID=D8U9X8_VOLCA|nr:uncharacterized protein VOLCADRAFT_96367 [Volvox carteri f. nagariensis]EFJ43551.1 hypothetical protein VOLCADRAFT_96367 [Volvox carteri f. nagariensis]|eukprot:XP_002955480.1 hypothetical protein VOLCADRAFT_96367 [Volvox carteri f. nagariensis]